MRRRRRSEDGCRPAAATILLSAPVDGVLELYAFPAGETAEAAATGAAVAIFDRQDAEGQALADAITWLQSSGAVTGNPLTGAVAAVSVAVPVTRAAAATRWACCCSTSTASRRSTTAMAMPSGTWCWRRSRTPRTARCAAPT